jgi:hypothetical protein
MSKADGGGGRKLLRMEQSASCEMYSIEERVFRTKKVLDVPWNSSLLAEPVIGLVDAVYSTTPAYNILPI